MDNTSRVLTAIQGLDRWLEAMRVHWPSTGYGGPVVHWWSQSRTYQGTGLDWRYEGVIAGYLMLWGRTGEPAWLDKAIRAGDDLVAGQLPDGTFRNSRFEQNPGTRGTPHEAAADVALLLLAQALSERALRESDRYLAAARRNLETVWFGQLWDDPSQTLWDSPGVPSFVPNKAATFVEAVLLLSELTGDSDLIEHYVVPTGQRILAMQVGATGDGLQGAIAQNRFADQVVAAYFPLYIARCVPVLVALYEITSDGAFREAALAAASFVVRVREPDGGFPQVLYPRGRLTRFPRWMAGVGDMLRAFNSVSRLGVEIDGGPTLSWLLDGVRSDGHIATAEGFGRITPLIGRRARAYDNVGVVGWCDKAFRALIELTPSVSIPLASGQQAMVSIGARW